MRRHWAARWTSCAPTNGDPVESWRVSSISCGDTACSTCFYAYSVVSAGLQLTSIIEQCARATTATGTFILNEVVSKRRKHFKYTSVSTWCSSSSSGNNEHVHSDIYAGGNHKAIDAHVGEYVQHEARGNKGGAGHVHCKQDHKWPQLRR